MYLAMEPQSTKVIKIYNLYILYILRGLRDSVAKINMYFL